MDKILSQILFFLNRFFVLIDRNRDFFISILRLNLYNRRAQLEFLQLLDD